MFISSLDCSGCQIERKFNILVHEKYMITQGNEDVKLIMHNSLVTKMGVLVDCQIGLCWQQTMHEFDVLGMKTTKIDDEMIGLNLNNNNKNKRTNITT